MFENILLKHRQTDKTEKQIKTVFESFFLVMRIIELKILSQRKLELLLGPNKSKLPTSKDYTFFNLF
jgi:hypothetical protein